MLLLQSGVTECEDVSYVSSPYLPACLLPRVSARKNETGHDIFTSNAHRKQEGARGSHNIQDQLSELIHLSDVHVLIG